GCANATAATRSRKCFSTSRAGVNTARWRNEPARRAGRIFAAAHRRDGAALLVSAALVLGAPHRADLLARRADADVGFPADLPVAADEYLRAHRRRAGRRGAVVGHPVSRPA